MFILRGLRFPGSHDIHRAAPIRVCVMQTVGHIPDLKMFGGHFYKCRLRMTILYLIVDR